MERPAVLLVEDQTDHADLLHAMLGVALPLRGPLARAGSLAEARRVLRSETFDLAIVDLGLPDASGVEAPQALCREFPGLAVVVLSSEGGEDTAIEAVRAGAQDFLVKGTVTPEVLRRALRHAIERCRLVKVLQESEARYRGLVESSAHGMLVHADGHVLFANAAAARVLGQGSAGEVMGRSVLEIGALSGNGAHTAPLAYDGAAAVQVILGTSAAGPAPASDAGRRG